MQTLTLQIPDVLMEQVIRRAEETEQAVEAVALSWLEQGASANTPQIWSPQATPETIAILERMLEEDRLSV